MLCFMFVFRESSANISVITKSLIIILLFRYNFEKRSDGRDVNRCLTRFLQYPLKKNDPHIHVLSGFLEFYVLNHGAEYGSIQEALRAIR
jgi:hypothetical protein